MSTPEEVAQELCRRFEEIPELEKAWPHEPEVLGALPCAAFLFNRAEAAETGTGPRLDVRWTWELRLYTNLSDLQAAQAQLNRIAWALFGVWRDDPKLQMPDGSRMVEWWELRDPGGTLNFDDRVKWLRKSMQVVAVLEHLEAA